MKRLSRRSKRSSLRAKRSALVLVFLFVFGACTNLFAQPVISALRPDEAAAGMTVMLEILAPASNTLAFGIDGLAPAGLSIALENSADSDRLVFGPPMVSWQGRLIQIPTIIQPSARSGQVPIVVRTALGAAREIFTIVQPEHLPPIDASGTVLLGFSGLGKLSKRNTMVVDSLHIVSTGGDRTTIQFDLTNPDTTAGNLRLQPIYILSRGPVYLQNIQLSVNADTVDGGPGGGGGGHGLSGSGGQGFTGGGSSVDLGFPVPKNIGSLTGPTNTNGGSSITNVVGGESTFGDQGGGGGTGNPFGTSGRAGANGSNSLPGGFGGGSGGGELAGQISYGGGGGGFSQDGKQGGGTGANQGLRNGGRFLIPLMGGSGGGAGNSQNSAPNAGSGGGGGGAIEIISYDKIILNNASVTAQGEPGTSGAALTAGGGGGSGGGIFLSAKKGFSYDRLQLIASGGAFGKGPSNGFDGGNGASGVLRLDGPRVGCDTCYLAGQLSSGLSINANGSDAIITSSTLEVQGIAPDSVNLGDSIRVFFRTNHSAWQEKDTVRVRSGPSLIWTCQLPLAHDSVLYVVAYQNVKNPRQSFADLEPAWIASTISIARFRHKATPNLVVLPANLNFDPLRIGQCETKKLVLTNASDSVLELDSLVLATGEFQIESTIPKTIAPYQSDTILIQFCPKTIGIRNARLNIFHDDSLSVVSLTGAGIARSDSIAIIPAFVAFQHTPVGACDSIAVDIFSKGLDTARLNVMPLPPPFTYRLRDSLLPPKSSTRLWIIYCPTDTVAVSARLHFSGRSDSLVIFGTAVEELLLPAKNIDLGTSCQGTVVAFNDTVLNRGNTNATIDSVHSTDSLLTPSSITGPFTIPAGQNKVFQFQIGIRPYIHPDTVLFYSGGKTFRSLVQWVSSRILLALSTPRMFQPACGMACDTQSISILNQGTEKLLFSKIQLRRGGEFSIIRSSDSVMPSVSGTVEIAYCPKQMLASSDTLMLRVTSPFCDTTLVVPLAGLGRASVLILSKDSIDFGSVSIDSCREDSLSISNPCAQNTRVTIASPSAFKSSAASISIPGETKQTIHFTFCPTAAIDTLQTAMFIAESGDTQFVRLRGRSRSVTSPSSFISIAIGSTIIRAGETGTIDVTVDSLSGDTLGGVTGDLIYDPSVVAPEAITSPFLGAETRPGLFHFWANRTIAPVISQRLPAKLFSVTWLGLFGSNSSTSIQGTLNTTIPNVVVVPGNIALLDCNQLPGKISIAGDYGLQLVWPTPTRDRLVVKYQIGAAGMVTLRLVDASGRECRKLVRQIPQSGSVEETIETTGLANGLYILSVESLGWTARAKVLIAK